MSKLMLAKEVVLWLIALFLALICLRSGLMKIPGVPGVESWIRDFTRWGYPDWFRVVVGVIELASFALLLVPRVAGIGASLFAIVMFGAVVTHLYNHEFVRLPFNLFLLGLCIVLISGRRSFPFKRESTVK